MCVSVFFFLLFKWLISLTDLMPYFSVNALHIHLNTRNDSIAQPNRQQNGRIEEAEKMWMINIEQTNCNCLECARAWFSIDDNGVRTRPWRECVSLNTFTFRSYSRTQFDWTCCGFGSVATRPIWTEKWSAYDQMKSEVWSMWMVK